ncbi:LOW QUALITY PROTEIN: uncharacterized protein C9orf152 homolog [Notechis scutatus]|uniref:LOW QUALITY PROTEIN: uncharacterized protein C9orf152 homolog n=1 Tax=Notechis scutatus TaxID=8663 RepID=A0A6J1V4F1_9SAUR|nr:LOW QUALITY PROTEIN: uncharacterized protein C9orf152 homolog [Notechis scutatus]
MPVILKITSNRILRNLANRRKIWHDGKLPGFAIKWFLGTQFLLYRRKGRNGTIPKESMISAVLINKSMRKALKGREIKVDLPCQGNGQDSSLWHIHLGIHRLGHHHGQPCDNVQNRTEHSMWSCEESLDSSEPAIAFSINEENSRPPEETVSSDSTRTSVTSIWDYSSLNISASKPVPSKLSYYPFPQKKNPKFLKLQGNLGYTSPIENFIREDSGRPIATAKVDTASFFLPRALA